MKTKKPPIIGGFFFSEKFRFPSLLCGAQLGAMHAHKVGAAEVVAVLDAIARIDELLREDLDGVTLIAPFEAAEKFKVEHFGIVVLEDHVFDFDGLEFFFVLGALFDVAMQVTVFRNRMAPEFTTAAGFLTNLELDALFLFVLG